MVVDGVVVTRVLPQTYYREIEIMHPVDDTTGQFLSRPKNLKHLSAEEQEAFKHIDRERPPTPPDVGPCDSVIALIREEPAAFVHQPQSRRTINVAPKPPSIPATFVPQKQYAESKGAEECVFGLCVFVR